jgi:hypothetical protein
LLKESGYNERLKNNFLNLKISLDF